MVMWHAYANSADLAENLKRKLQNCFLAHLLLVLLVALPYYPVNFQYRRP